MKFTARDVNVDSGEFVIADPEILGHDWIDRPRKPFFAHLEKMQNLKSDYTEFRVSNGTYRVSWNLLNGPFDKHTGKGTLKVVSGRIWVVDPLYVTENYDYRHPPSGIVVVNKTGGDGSFDVDFTLTRK